MRLKSERPLLCVFAILILVTLGCQTSPTRYDSQSEGQWSARILVKDKKRGRSQIVSVDINAVKNEKIRADVTAALGTPVASLVVDGDKTQYILFQQKSFYQGNTRPQVMEPILSIEMDPRLLHSILFDEEVKLSGWSCERDAKNFLRLCEAEKAGLRIEWSERRGRKKIVKVEHSRASLQISFESYKPKVAEKQDLFSLKAPKDFKTHTLR